MRRIGRYLLWMVAVGAYWFIRLLRLRVVSITLTAATLLGLTIVANGITIIPQWPELLFSGDYHYLAIGLAWPFVNWG